MISYAEAMAEVLQHAGQLSVESVPLEAAHGRTLAEAVVSRRPMPPVDQAAVDGYALHCGSKSLPLGSELPLVSIRRLTREHDPAQHGWARRIHKNAPMPDGMDAVLPLDQGQRLPPDAEGRLRLRLKAALRGGDHVYRQGAEADTGTEILPAGEVLDGPRLLLAGTVGADRLRVVSRPQVAIFSAEQTPRDGLERCCPGTSGRDINGSYLEMMARTAGADVRMNRSLGQCGDYFVAMLQQVRDLSLDVIICTREETAPRGEQMMSSLRALEARILFSKVAVTPGSSLICAQFPGGSLFFGISAEPRAMAAACRFFLIPTLTSMQGRPAERPVLARLAPPLWPAGSRLPSFRRARLYQHGDGSLWVQIPRSDDPFALQGLRGSNAWAVVPPHAPTWRDEMRLEVYGTLPDMLDIPLERHRSEIG